MFDEDDELTSPPPHHNRPSRLLVLLVFTVVAAGVGLWFLSRPQPSTPAPNFELSPNTIGRAEREAKQLPEYGELQVMAKRPLTDEDISRALELTRHPNAWIRLLARGVLAKVREGPRRAEAVEAVAAGLREENGSLRAAAMHDLATMNAREKKADLRALLASPIEEDRSCAHHALQRMGLPVK